MDITAVLMLRRQNRSYTLALRPYVFFAAARTLTPARLSIG